MHELSYMMHICNLAIETAEENYASKVYKILVQVGQMSGIVPEYLQHYFPDVVRGTILEGAELETEMVPVLAQCENCGTRYHPTRENRYSCPECGSSDAHLLAGRDIVLKQVIIDHEADSNR
ncbi:MAG: hydrogenase maturation nickel metallochaperone HypA [Bilifractor sp.]